MPARSLQLSAFIGDTFCEFDFHDYFIRPISSYLANDLRASHMNVVLTVDFTPGGVSDACAVCKRISSMKAFQLGRGLVKSTNFHWSIFETEIWAFPHKESARSICFGSLLQCGQIDPR